MSSKHWAVVAPLLLLPAAAPARAEEGIQVFGMEEIKDFGSDNDIRNKSQCYISNLDLPYNRQASFAEVQPGVGGRRMLTIKIVYAPSSESFPLGVDEDLNVTKFPDGKRSELSIYYSEKPPPYLFADKNIITVRRDKDKILADIQTPWPPEELPFEKQGLKRLKVAHECGLF